MAADDMRERYFVCPQCFTTLGGHWEVWHGWGSMGEPLVTHTLVLRCPHRACWGSEPGRELRLTPMEVARLPDAQRAVLRRIVPEEDDGLPLGIPG